MEEEKMKTISQVLEEDRNRQNPKIQTLVIESSGSDRSTYCYHDVSNLHENSDNKGEFLEFDAAPGRHIKIYGYIILKEETMSTTAP